MENNELTPKQRAQYIWDYYKLHIIGVLVLIALAAWGINNYILHPAPELCCGIAIYGPHISAESVDALENTVTAQITSPDENLTAEVDNFFFTEGQGSEDKLQDRNMLDKFYTYLYALQLDIFIGTKEDTLACVKADFVETADKYIPAEQMEAYEKDGRLLYGKDSDDKEQMPYAVELKNSALLKSMDILQDDTYYICFIPVTGREERAKKAAQLFLGE